MGKDTFEADTLYRVMRENFDKIDDHRHHLGKVKTSISDALMCGLAVFALKFPSLLKFEEAARDEEQQTNLKALFGVESFPSDQGLRDILDKIDPENLRANFDRVFLDLQRSKKLEKFQFIDGKYLIALDGSNYFASSKIRCNHCIVKKAGKKDESYYHQVLAGSIVHPESSVVVPLFPEPIMTTDGESKQDCEINAATRWILSFRRNHPKLNAIILQDALTSTGPYIRLLKQNNLSFILGAKPGKHKYLFDTFTLNQKHNLTQKHEVVYITGDKVKKRVTHSFEYLNELELNCSNSDLKVNFLNFEEKTEYVNPMDDKKGIGTKIKKFSWISDIKITKENIYSIMRAGRGRWKIENETFKTLKEESTYNIEHNFGHGSRYLSSVFAVLAFLSFLIDQVQEMGSDRFKKMLKIAVRKSYLWELIKSLYAHCVSVNSWEMFYGIITKDVKLVAVPNSS